MCIFSRNVRFVGKTRIFARLDGARQMLAYSMSVDVDAALAMVLPLPVSPRSPEDAVRFIDLRGYSEFFEKLALAFPIAFAGAAPQARSLSFGLEVQKLVVHDVGDFIASFVPTQKDFARLDERFRLKEDVFAALPQYDDWGFAVFQLKPSAKRQDVHPMAFSFPRREARSIFFPTVHVHHDRVEREAQFDHTLYCQADGVLGATLDWGRSADRLGAYVDAERARGVIDGAAIGFQQTLFGALANEDIWLREPSDVRLEDLTGKGECFDYALGGSENLGALSQALREGLPALVHARRSAWRLAPITPDMPLHFMNGDRLWSGDDYMTGRPNPRRDVRGVIRFSPFTQHVRPQTVRLGFDVLPEDDTIGHIRRSLADILNGVLS